MAQSTSKARQAYSALYKSSNRCVTNRKLKLMRVLKQQPNNEQVKDALVNAKYRRRTPGQNSIWNATNIRIAKLFKEFTGRASHELFSSNPKTAAAAMSMHSNTSNLKVIEGRVSFSLGARAHDAKGNLVWK